APDQAHRLLVPGALRDPRLPGEPVPGTCARPRAATVHGGPLRTVAGPLLPDARRGVGRPQGRPGADVGPQSRPGPRPSTGRGTGGGLTPPVVGWRSGGPLGGRHSSMKMHSPGHSSAASLTASSKAEGTSATP